jgi:hypothetical protein
VIGKALIREVHDVMTSRSLVEKRVFGNNTFNDQTSRKRALEVSVWQERVNDLDRSFPR